MNKQTVSIGELIPLIKEKIEAGGEITVKVKGSSMNPFFISDKTNVTLGKPDSLFHRLDVVLYKNEKDNYALHRIVGIKGNFLVICGDALQKNELISSNRVIARVTSFSTGDATTKTINKTYLSRAKWWVFFKPFRRVILWAKRHVGGSKHHG